MPPIRREKRTMSEQTRIDEQLDQLVLERTSELAAANDALRKELAAERQRAEAAQRTLTDIDERRRAEDALRHSEASLRAIVETTPECVHVIARDGNLLSVNAAGAEMAGAPSVDLMLGRNFYGFVTPEDRERYRAFNESICTGQKGFLEFDIVRMDGERRHLETRAAPLRSDDGTVAHWALRGTSRLANRPTHDCARVNAACAS
jgi:PAS domain S-box-containing protein